MSYNISSKPKKQDNSGFSFLIIIGFFILALSINSIKLIREYFVKKQILAKSQQEQIEIKEQQNKLKLDIKKSQSQQYIEEQARKLTLSKPNEVVVIMSSPKPVRTVTKAPLPKIANYKLWWQLFFP